MILSILLGCVCLVFVCICANSFNPQFAALIHDVKHLGLPNAQLEKDNHCLISVYQESYLERQSITVGLGIFIEEFPELSTAVLRMCPGQLLIPNVLQ